LVLSLAAKASGYDREFNSLPELTREFTEWYAARIPTLELHPPSKNAGLSLEDGILGGAWSFYMAFADRLNGRLAYIVCSDGTVTYGNDGAWVRSYGDVTAAFLLAKKMNAMTFIQPFVAYLRARKETDPRSFAARLSFLRTTSPSSSALECRMLAARIIEEKQFVDPSDMSFGSPEAMLALLSFAPNSQKVREARSLFVQKYVEEGWAAKAIAENGAFAAHWIMRALTNDKVERLCVPVCVDAIQKGASITIEACALSGLVVAKGRGWVESQPWYGPLINRWRSDQHKWFSEARGGFRYYRDQAWYRSDVTSHVVESLLIQMWKERTPENLMTESTMRRFWYDKRNTPPLAALTLTFKFNCRKKRPDLHFCRLNIQDFRLHRIDSPSLGILSPFRDGFANNEWVGFNFVDIGIEKPMPSYDFVSRSRSDFYNARRAAVLKFFRFNK
jgi:hypothetical protein